MQHFLIKVTSSHNCIHKFLSFLDNEDINSLSNTSHNIQDCIYRVQYWFIGSTVSLTTLQSSVHTGHAFQESILHTSEDVIYRCLSSLSVGRDLKLCMKPFHFTNLLIMPPGCHLPSIDTSFGSLIASSITQSNLIHTNNTITNSSMKVTAEKQLSVSFSLLFISELVGWGVVSNQVIPSGTLLTAYCGEFISSKETERRHFQRSTQVSTDIILMGLCLC